MKLSKVPIMNECIKERIKSKAIDALNELRDFYIYYKYDECDDIDCEFAIYRIDQMLDALYSL